MAVPLRYNWRNLAARPLSTTLTLIVVAVLIIVLAVALAFAAGIRASLVATGSTDNIIVLKPGATAETMSIILPEEATRLAQTPGVAKDPAGNQLISSEVCVQTDIPRRTGGTANVALRGVDDVAFQVHREIKVVQGRLFQQGQLELIVGRAAQNRFTGLDLDSEIVLGRHSQRRYRVVGIFEARGGAMESEIWGPRTMLADSYARRFASSICLRLEDKRRAVDSLAYINGPSVQLDGKIETDYYDELSRTTRQIVQLTTVLIGIMAVGAVFAVANTMYSAVDGRRREIAMLRAIGFGRHSIIVALIAESVILCALSCAVGLIASKLITLGMARQDYLSDQTWTVLAYDLRLTPAIIGLCVGLAVVVGAVGALAPALRAARINVLEALRKA
jgi:ABC-type lipoprotein release transport system permease subunit